MSMTQGFRKSFSAWGLNFKQFSAGFNFEIVGQLAIRISSIKTNMCHTDSHQHWNYENQTRKKLLIWNTLYTEKRSLIFFQIKAYLLQHLTSIRRFQHGSPLLLGNKGSMQGLKQPSQCTQWSLVVSMQGNIRAWTRNLKKKIILINFILLLEWAKGLTFIYSFFFSINIITQQKDRPVLWWIILILAVSAWFDNCPHQLRL